MMGYIKLVRSVREANNLQSETLNGRYDVGNQDVDGRLSKIGVEVDCDEENANQNNMEWQVLLNMVLKLRFSLKAGNFFTS
jgi:hypothetical protein